LYKSARIPEDAIGCDWFGYLRQARLFREHGVYGGLNTAIDDERTRYLVSIGKRIGEPAEWEDGVAPHCHHYAVSTDRVILQYPPATGFLLSFFEEGTQARSAFVVSDLVVLTVLMLTAAGASTWTAPLVTIAIGGVFFAGLFRFSEDWSVPLSGAILLVAAWLTVRASLARTQRQRVVSTALLGIVLGLSADVRGMNLFIAIGPLLMLGVTVARERSAAALWAMVAACGGLLIGMLPTFVFNTINGGHPLRTTYPSYDLAGPVVTWRMVSSALRFYFADEPFNQLFAMGALFAVPVIVFRRRLAAPRVAWAAASGALAFAVSLAYLLTHTILVPYYVFPAAAYATAAALFSLVASENVRARLEAGPSVGFGVRAGLAAAALLATIPIVRAQTMPLSPLFAEISNTSGQSGGASTIEPSAIIWGDLGTGNVSYFLRRQAAKLVALSPSMQERFIAEIEADGVPQYLLNDSERMEVLIARWEKAGRVRKSTRVLDYDVYAIQAGWGGNRGSRP
jgi:hypothetical protein